MSLLHEADSDTCPKCGSKPSEFLWHCPACGHDLGFPNVRAASSGIEQKALQGRYQDARVSAGKRGVVEVFDAVVAEINSSSHVVVSMPPFIARKLLQDPRQIYAGYETLVGAGLRTPAPFANDSDRFSVGSKLFGSFADEIRYGVLSLDGTSLKNYGSVFLQLRDVTIEHRVSFLHENSFLFLEFHKVSVRGELPRGFQSNWQNRGELAAAKMEPDLQAGSTRAQWAGQIVIQGPSRADDRCIEGHIFGGFNADAIDSISFAGIGESRAEKNDIEIIQELMAKRK